MRAFRMAVGTGLSGLLSAVAGGLPAWATNPSQLPWHSPHAIVSGTPFDVASIAPCPPVPTPGDQLLVGITVTFTGGGMGNVLSANPDGSWSGQLTFTFSGAPRQAGITADCEDFNGVFATTYAEYQTHHTQLLSP
jgi:hypothetical protein